jgi:hypothetical protein
MAPSQGIIGTVIMGPRKRKLNLLISASLLHEEKASVQISFYNRKFNILSQNPFTCTQDLDIFNLKKKIHDQLP